MIINSLIEMFTIVMLYTILFEEINIKGCSLNLLIATICTVKSKYTSYMGLNIVNFIISTIIIIVTFKIVYKTNIYNIVVRFLISLAIILIPESLIGIIVGSFKINTSSYILTLVLILVFIITLIITKLFLKSFIVELEDKIVDNIKIYLLPIFNILLLFVVLKYIINRIDFKNVELVIIFTMALGMIIINIVATNYITKEIKRKKALEIEGEYNPILDKYFQSLKATEHEYKNHLNVIYTMLEVSDDEEIRTLVKGYIKDTKRYDHLSNLMYLDNHILKSLMYSKICEAEDKGINFTYGINTSLKNLIMDNLELVILLSNLLNNAIEAAEVSERKIVDLRISELDLKGETSHKFIVKNTIKNLKGINAIDMFSKGYSTKGQNRGFGLYNVQKIIKRLNGSITMELEEDTIIIEVTI